MYTASTRLADVIFGDYTVITLLNRFGITLGVGDQSIGAICAERGIDAAFFTTLLNIYTGSSCRQADGIGMDFIKPTIEYLKSSNDYYADTALPNIERHFRALHDRSVAENNLEFLWIFFQELKTELHSRFRYDNEKRFPLLSAMADAPTGDSCAELAECPECDQAIEDKVDDLTSFFVIHLRGEYDQNLCMAVVTALMALEKDIKRNNVIRQQLLRQASGALTCDNPG